MKKQIMLLSIQIILTVIRGAISVSTKTLNDAPPLPIIIWHGMGDTCCNPLSTGSFMDIIKEALSCDDNNSASQRHECHIWSVGEDESVAKDWESGFYGSIDQQVEHVCQHIANNTELYKDGYNGIGLSQGGLFMRAVAQRCDGDRDGKKVRMRNLISIGGPQQGVYGVPQCPPDHHYLCSQLSKAVSSIVYDSPIQSSLIQAQYWHDPLNLETYRNGSRCIAELNNESTEMDEKMKVAQKQNLLTLKNFVMVKFSQDQVVYPSDSEWFGFYDQHLNTVDLEKSDLYMDNDRIGLKKMNEDGRLKFLTCPGRHLQISESFIIHEIVPYLK